MRNNSTSTCWWRGIVRRTACKSPRACQVVAALGDIIFFSRIWYFIRVGILHKKSARTFSVSPSLYSVYARSSKDRAFLHTNTCRKHHQNMRGLALRASPQLISPPVRFDGGNPGCMILTTPSSSSQCRSFGDRKYTGKKHKQPPNKYDADRPNQASWTSSPAERKLAV